MPRLIPPPIKDIMTNHKTGLPGRPWVEWFSRLLHSVNSIDDNDLADYGSLISTLYSRIEALEKEIYSRPAQLFPNLPFYLGALVKFDKDGILTTGTFERHIQVIAQEVGLPANQPTATEIGTAAAWQFASAGTQEELHFQWELPEDWVGDDIIIEIDWLPDSGAMTNPATIKWVFEYYSVAEGESIVNGTMATQSITYDTTTAQNLIIHSPVTFAYNDANQPLTKGDHIFVRCYRDTTVANDFAGTVAATAFEIIYNSNQIPTGN